MEQLKIFLHLLKNSFKNLVPIIVVITFFQLIIIQQISENTLHLIIGLSIVTVGLNIFIQGLKTGIFPLEENLANGFAKKGSLFWLFLFYFLIGFSITIAEPSQMQKLYLKGGLIVYGYCFYYTY